MAYGARLESVLGESPQGFESPILRGLISRDIVHTRSERCLIVSALSGLPSFLVIRFVRAVVPVGADGVGD